LGINPNAFFLVFSLLLLEKKLKGKKKKAILSTVCTLGLWKIHEDKHSMLKALMLY